MSQPRHIAITGITLIAAASFAHGGTVNVQTATTSSISWTITGVAFPARTINGTSWSPGDDILLTYTGSDSAAIVPVVLTSPTLLNLTYEGMDVNSISINGNFNFSSTDSTPLKTGLITVGNSFSSTISAKIDDGALAFTKAGAGTLTLTNGTNGFQSVTLSEGTLAVNSLANGGQASALGASSNAAGNLVFSGAATLAYTGGGASTNRLFTVNSTGKAVIENNGSGALAFTNTGAVAYGTPAQSRTVALGGTNTGANEFTPLLGDNNGALVSFIKEGVGSWALKGANTYSGATTVSAGTLLVTGSINNSAVTVASGAVFGGSGSSGAITLQSGATLSPGSYESDVANRAGTFSAASLNWTGGATLRFNLGATSDKLQLTGALTKSGAAGGVYAFDFLNAAPAIGTTYTLITAGSVSGFNAVDFTYTNLAAGRAARFDFAGNDLVLTIIAVPEPLWSAGTPLVVALAVIARRRRKTR